MKRRFAWKEFIIPIFVIGIVIITGVLYSHQVHEAIWKQAEIYVKETTKQARRAFDTYLSKDIEILQGLKRSCTHISGDDAEQIRENIMQFQDSDSAYYIINLEKNIVHSNHGEEKELIGTEIDKYALYTGCEINEPKNSPFTGLNVLSCYEDFRFSDGTKGLVISEHSAEKIVKEFAISIYDGGGYSDVVNSDGKIILRSKQRKYNHEGTNLFDIADKKGKNPKKVEALIEDMANGKSGIAYFEEDGERYMYIYDALEYKEGWYIVSCVSNSETTRQAHKAIVNPGLITLIIIACLTMFATFWMIEAYFHRQLRHKEKEQRYLRELVKTYGAVADSVLLVLSGTDYSVEYISENAEKILGVHAGTIRENLENLGQAEYEEGIKIGYDDLRDIRPEQSCSYKTKRVHGVSGKTISFTEHIHRITTHEGEKLIIIISQTE